MARHGSIPQFELFVMLAVAHLGDAAYGVAIRREIEDRSGRTVVIGAVYAALGRLEDKGWLSHTISDPQPVRGGRSRKYYSLTPSGAAELADAAGALERMLAGLDVTGLVKGRQG